MKVTHKMDHPCPDKRGIAVYLSFPEGEQIDVIFRIWTGWATGHTCALFIFVH